MTTARGPHARVVEDADGVHLSLRHGVAVGERVVVTCRDARVTGVATTPTRIVLDDDRCFDRLVDELHIRRADHDKPLPE